MRCVRSPEDAKRAGSWLPWAKYLNAKEYYIYASVP